MTQGRSAEQYHRARSALQKLRTIPMGAAAGMAGVAEYKLLIGKDAVLRFEQAGNRSVSGGEERLTKAKLSGFMPAHSDARLVVVGMLNCHDDVCEFMLEP